MDASSASCTAFTDLIMRNSWKQVVSLANTESPTVLSQTNSQGETALHEACRRGAPVFVVDALLKAYPDAALMVDWLGRTPLHLSCSMASASSVTSDLIRTIARFCPQSVERANKYGSTPLHLACTHGASLKCIKVLIDLSPQDLLLHGNIEQYTPLHFACDRYASPEVVKLLASSCPESISRKNKYGYTPLHFAARAYNADVIQFLTDLRPDAVSITNNGGNTPLHVVCERGFLTNDDTLQMIRIFLRACPDLVFIANSEGCTPMHFACRHGAGADHIRALLSTNPHVVALQQEYRMRYTPLHLLCLTPKPCLDRVRAVVNACPQVVVVKNKTGCTPLFLLSNHLPRELIADSDNIDISTSNSAEESDESGHSSDNNNSSSSSSDVDSSTLLEQHQTLWEVVSLLISVERALFATPENLELGKTYDVDANGMVATRRCDTILHDALQVDRCAVALVRFIIKVHPSLVHVRDDDGNLPLHIEASLRRNYCDVDNENDESEGITKELLRYNPKAAKEFNNEQKLPLTLMIESGRSWDGGIKYVLMANPTGLYCHDGLDIRFFPQLLSKISKDCPFDTLYEVIRGRPEIVQGGAGQKLSDFMLLKSNFEAMFRLLCKDQLQRRKTA